MRRKWSSIREREREREMRERERRWEKATVKNCKIASERRKKKHKKTKLKLRVGELTKVRE